MEKVFYSSRNSEIINLLLNFSPIMPKTAVVYQIPLKGMMLSSVSLWFLRLLKAASYDVFA